MPFLHATNRLTEEKIAYISSKTLLDNWNWVWFPSLKAKSRWNQPHFFPPIYTRQDHFLLKRSIYGMCSQTRYGMVSEGNKTYKNE